jgi:hypothetical protein
VSKYSAGVELTADYLNAPADAFWAGYAQQLKYTASGTFTKASYPGLRGIIVECQGGGGGGGGTGATAAGTVAAAAGGGGGGFIRCWIPVSTLGTSETVTVGAAGAGGVGTGAATSGGNTTFGSFVTALGGANGESIAASSSSVRTQGGNAGSVSSTGTGVVELFTRVGDTGGSGGQKGTEATEAGVGGSSFCGGGGRVSAANAGGNGVAPVGGAYGAGGAAAWADVSQSAFNGGDGLAGVCRVLPVY